MYVPKGSSCIQKTLIVRGFLMALAGAILAPQKSCFVTSSKRGSPLEVEDANRVNVYVYDDPEFDHTALIQCYRDRQGVSPWQDERTDMAQNMGEIWLHHSLLTHPWRVFDPEEADVFFIPLYPVPGFKLLTTRKVCDGLSHPQRVTRSIMHLVRKSPYFNRFGGADHVVVCAWHCGSRALGPQHRMLLRRAVVGINEKLERWSMWGRLRRMVTVPYTPSSVLTTPDMIGGLGAGGKAIPFTFVGTARRGPKGKT